MSDLTDLWHAHIMNVTRFAAEDTERILQRSSLEDQAREARLLCQIEEDKARAEFLQMTREELAQFRAWLQRRDGSWEMER